MEPYCLDIAKKMLEVDTLPSDLEYKILKVEEMVKSVKPHGCLSSTQTIAIIILLWELEQTLDKFEWKHRDANY